MEAEFIPIEQELDSGVANDDAQDAAFDYAAVDAGGDAPGPHTPRGAAVERPSPSDCSARRDRSAPQPFIAERLAGATEAPDSSPWGLHPPLQAAAPVLPAGLGINPTYTSPRQRLGALPSRAGRSVSAPAGSHLLHRHSPAPSTKQPNLAAVGEDDPYPPANAEVTLELQRQTLKHGRKLIQYCASRPLDTIHIKIPNTSPGLLTQPVLANLRHVIDLGHQRIVVGGSLRPGCALLSLDLMDLTGAAPQLRLAPAGGAGGGRAGGGSAAAAAADGQMDVEQLLLVQGDAGDAAAGGGAGAGGELPLDAGQLLAVLGVVRAAESVPIGSRVQLQAGAALWEGTYVPLRRDEAGAVQGPEQVEPEQAAAASPNEAGRWQWQQLDPWQGSIGWDAGSPVAEDGGPGLFVDAAAPPSTPLRMSPLHSAETPRMDLSASTAADASASPSRRRPVHDPRLAAAEPRVQLQVARQVMLVPAAGQPLHMFVRVGGLPGPGVSPEPGAAHKQAQPAGAGTSTRGGGAATAGFDGAGYTFAVRSLGRCLPVHGVPAPMTPPAASATATEPQAVAAHTSCPGAPAQPGQGRVSAPGVGWPASRSRAEVAGLHFSSWLPTSVSVTEEELPSGRSSTNGGPVSGASAADLEAAVQAAAVASASGHGASTAGEQAVAPRSLNPDGCFELSVTGLTASAAAAAASSNRPHRLQPPGPQLLQLELWRDGARVLVASKPLLLLPAGEAALVAELQRLVALQDELDQAYDLVAPAQAAAAPGNRVQPLEPSSADQLVSDVGQWLEFVHAELQASAAEAASQSSGAPPPAVVLRGSVDLRDQVLGVRRAAPGYGSSMLCLGMELLEAAVQLGSGVTAASVMAGFGALGYSVPEVWASLGEVDMSELAAGSAAPGEVRQAGASASVPVLQALAQAGGDPDVAGLVQDWAAQAARAAAAIPAMPMAELAGPAAASTAQPAPAASAELTKPEPASAAVPVRSMAGLVRASLLGFADAAQERRYQQFLSARSAGSGASWVCVHLMLLAAACSRLAADGRLGLDLPAAALFSSAYVIMSFVLLADRLHPGLLTRHRVACWVMTSMLRSGAKLPQLAGWVLVPPSTITHVRAGSTLIADCVLPSAFEPLPVPLVLLVSLWDVVLCTAFYRQIGHEPALHAAVFKTCLSLAVRCAVDAMYRLSFVRAEARGAGTPVRQRGTPGKAAAVAHKEHVE
ncbi:hypothetical protein HXX76_006647 [Chlamydomonas incerta]|uniref:Uncharacterized protein n=1 Tax=Chlamydomonas incerta TaxID=51695 RepID=A0A835T591_CHLIN|nr:hypothetical protein HXX76_006647 [Chlamydomonas incerta]|eukprot:KAG2436338.1 hypothetical protein HXX76_006647 [Chlamydomonas incerta]